MQLDIKVKIICAASDDYCYFSYNDKALKIGPLQKRFMMATFVQWIIITCGVVAFQK